MAKPVIFVPGLAGSNLDRQGNLFQENVWVSYTSLSVGDFQLLKLAPNGIDPDPDVGYDLHQNGVLQSIYQPFMRMFNSQLRIEGYELIEFGYDFRKDLTLSGNLLAAQVRIQFAADGPVTLVAHSMGGIVARLAWAALKATNESSMIRRIITLGTPHQGAYESVMVVLGDNETVLQVTLASQLFTGGTVGVGLKGISIKPWKGPQYATTLQVANIIATWPGLYWLYPMLGGTDAEGDDQREEVYDEANYSDLCEVSRTWLLDAESRVGTFLRDATKIPPYDVLTTVAGGARTTRWGLTDPSLLVRGKGIGTTEDGDGRVTTKSALILNSRQWWVSAAHLDLPLVTTQSGDLIQMVTEERDVLDPLPRSNILGTFAATIKGIVYPNGTPTVTAATPCPPGTCQC